MIVKIFVSPTDAYTIEDADKSKRKDCYYIGCDKGAYYALQSGVSLDLALGDFDSTTDSETAYIKKHAKKVLTFPARKDFTDSYLAVSEALKHNPEEILIYGGMGKRFDHTFANVNLLKLGPIVLLSDHTKMYILNPGQYTIDNRYGIISFFALEDVLDLSLQGFSYELKSYDLAVDDPLCVSNAGSGSVSFEEGLLLVVESRE